MRPLLLPLLLLGIAHRSLSNRPSSRPTATLANSKPPRPSTVNRTTRRGCNGGEHLDRAK
ncbi:unnamed protein product, partial [Dovyalis caffra]